MQSISITNPFAREITFLKAPSGFSASSSAAFQLSEVCSEQSVQTPMLPLIWVTILSKTFLSTLNRLELINNYDNHY
ncbi:MAG: hypothetical protein SGI89_02315 [bacterium]|nr:hypothetical protein [bacterium]